MKRKTYMKLPKASLRRAEKILGPPSESRVGAATIYLLERMKRLRDPARMPPRI